MDHHVQLDHLHDLPRPSITSAIAYTFVLLYGLHLLLTYLDFPILSPREILWNALVYSLPTPLLLDSTRRQELRANGMLSNTHAAKSDALRRLLGVGGNAILQKLPKNEAVGGIMRRMSTSISGSKKTGVVSSDVPAGLGNWDNSCYQNSVLQALSSLGSLRHWLRTAEPPNATAGSTTNTSLQELVEKLRDPTNNGRHIWTPAKLKNMSSWQQQDAQEYFSKIMDELDKEAAKVANARAYKPGLETFVELERTEESKDEDEEVQEYLPRNPLEGLIAQRVGCTSCGFSEGYSMIPFNCLTVSLGSHLSYELEECLDEYTKSEDIEGVECGSCTLLHAQSKLRTLVDLPPELRGQIAERLRAIEEALERDDFSDTTLKQKCQIPSKAFVSSTKTKEAIVGRAPQSLVIHVNRSVFDEMTGMQRKNYAHVQYPLELNLRRWMLSAGDTPAQYRLSAVVTHYGRHENGHYICYRKHPRNEVFDNAIEPDDDLYGAVKEGWWRLSDEDVSPVTEDEVIGQGGVFMLFYERVEPCESHSATDEVKIATTAGNVAEAAAIALPPDETADWEDLGVEQGSTATPSLVTSSSQSVVSESDTDVEFDGAEGDTETKTVEKSTQAPLMKTANPGYADIPQKYMKHDVGMSRSMMSV